MLLGGMFTSRLNQNLREKHGYTYGARSQVMRMDGVGYWVAQAAIGARRKRPSRWSSCAAKSGWRYVTSCARRKNYRVPGNGAIQRLVMQSERTAESSSSMRRLRAIVCRATSLQLLAGAQNATPTRLQEVSKNRLKPDEATIVIVGDVQRCCPSCRRRSVFPMCKCAMRKATSFRRSPPSEAKLQTGQSCKFAGLRLDG